MRVIDPNELSSRMYHEAFEKDSDMQRWDGGCWIRYKVFENCLADTPIIDVEEPKYGEWISDPKNQGGFTPGGNTVKSCSECGWIYGAHKIVADYNFCPNCGAKMRGKNVG
jgi:DNA-directed RNA polymerase subunit RPC12/RpoP